MNQPKLASFLTFLWVSLVLCVIGWGGLVFVVFYTLPYLGPRWLFYFLLTLALSGTALPVAYFINRRFPSIPPADSGVVLREAMWVGVYGSLLAWLQQGQVLTSGLALILAGGLVVVELLLRLSERSQWAPAQGEAPPDPDDEDDPYEGDEDD